MLTTKKELIVAYLGHTLLNILYYIVKTITITLVGALYVHIIARFYEWPFTDMIETIHLIPMLILYIFITCKRLFEEMEGMQFNVFEPSLYMILWLIFLSTTNGNNMDQLIHKLLIILCIMLIMFIINKCNKPIYDKIVIESIIADPSSWMSSYKVLHDHKINNQTINKLSKLIIKPNFQSCITILGYDDMRHSSQRYTYTKQTMIFGLRLKYYGIIKLCNFSLAELESEAASVKGICRYLKRRQTIKRKVRQTRRQKRIKK